MARINIEDSIYKDGRFLDLCIALGDKDKALGGLFRAWALAQTWYLTPEKMIPFKEWSAQRIPGAIIEVGLAERVGDKVRMSGVEKQFDWLLQRHRAGSRGGLKSQENRQSDRLATAEQNQPSSLLTLYSSLPTHNSKLFTQEQNEAKQFIKDKFLKKATKGMPK